MNIGRFTFRYFLALALFNLAACSSMQPVSIERAVQASPPPGVDLGSLVEIQTMDDRRVEFRVTDITEDGLGGQMGHFSYSNMRSLKVEQPGSGSEETWAWVLGILGAAALVALIANADSVAICSPSPCETPPPGR
jgi:hypothetical protein